MPIPPKNFPSIPQRNVPQVADEETTPIDMPLPAVLERRSKQTKEGVEGVAANVSLMRSEIASLDRKVEIYVENDQRDHQLLRNELAAFAKKHDEQLATFAKKHEELDKKVDDIAVASASANGKLDILVKSVEREADLKVTEQKVKIELTAHQKRLETEDAADEKKFKRQKWLKIFGIITTIAGAVAGSISIASC